MTMRTLLVLFKGIYCLLW